MSPAPPPSVRAAATRPMDVPGASRGSKHGHVALEVAVEVTRDRNRNADALRYFNRWAAEQARRVVRADDEVVRHSIDKACNLTGRLIADVNATDIHA